MHRYQSLTVALARGELDGGLIRYAAAVARMGTAHTMRFVHVLPSVAADGRPDRDAVLAELQTEVAQHAPGLPAGVEVTYAVLEGPLTDGLLSHVAETETDLLFVGHRTSHPGRKALARRLAMKTPCSVWMVPQHSKPAFGRMLVPVDFSEPAADSLQVATSMASLAGGAECVALHVYFDETLVTYEGYEEVLRGEERQAYEAFVAPIDLHGVAVRPIFEESMHVADTIGRVADREGADLIVMATRGRSRSSAILLGSTAEDVIMSTQTPMLVVKHFGARMSVLQAVLDKRFRHKGNLHTG